MTFAASLPTNPKIPPETVYQGVIEGGVMTQGKNALLDPTFFLLYQRTPIQMILLKENLYLKIQNSIFLVAEGLKKCSCC